MKKSVRVLCFILALTLAMLVTGCGSSGSNWDKQVEKTQNELYKKGSDGKWYPK